MAPIFTNSWKKQLRMLEGRAAVERAPNPAVAWQGPQKIQQRQNQSPVLEQDNTLQLHGLEVH